MKIRIGFVSNSSSSSFILKLDNVSDEQLRKIFCYLHYGKNQLPEDPREWYSYEWEFHFEYDNYLLGETPMTNFNMKEFFMEEGIPMKDVGWEEDYTFDETYRKFQDEMKEADEDEYFFCVRCDQEFFRKKGSEKNVCLWCENLIRCPRCGKWGFDDKIGILESEEELSDDEVKLLHERKSEEHVGLDDLMNLGKWSGE